MIKKLAGVGLGDIDSSILEQLELCLCWGHHKAALMLATLHLSGLGVPVDQEKVTAQDLVLIACGMLDHVCIVKNSRLIDLCKRSHMECSHANLMAIFLIRVTCTA